MTDIGNLHFSFARALSNLSRSLNTRCRPQVGGYLVAHRGRTAAEEPPDHLASMNWRVLDGVHHYESRR